MIEQYAYKWFVVYYFLLSLFMIYPGAKWLFASEIAIKRMSEFLKLEKPPATFLKLLKYLFLFSGVNLALSFFPFNWKHLFHSVWMLMMIFIVGRFLVNWESFGQYWEKRAESLPSFFQKVGALIIFCGFATGILMYFSI